MTQIDISLLGKRYPELNETLNIGSSAIMAVYKTGQPELDRITWLNVQKSAEIINLKDLDGVSLSDNDFLRWSIAQNKFIPGIIQLDDIPDLPTSIITSGIFPVSRIPDLSISKITGLQTELDGKEPAFSKGNIVSSTLALTGNLGRLFGSGNLGIEIDTSVFENLFIPATRTINFVSDDQSVFINGVHNYVKDLNNPNETINLEVNIIPYVHPIGFPNQPPLAPLSGAEVFSQLIITDEGHVENYISRTLTKTDIGLGNVDNTSDLDKPISTATQAAIDDLDNRFLRKDADDNNGLFTLTLNNLIVENTLTLNGVADELSPDYALVVMMDGTVRRSEIITPGDITDLQDQIDNLVLQVNSIVQDKNLEFVQDTPSTIWTAVHNFGRRPSVNVWDSSGNPIISYEVLINDGVTFSIELSSAIIGRIDLT